MTLDEVTTVYGVVEAKVAHLVSMCLCLASTVDA